MGRKDTAENESRDGQGGGRTHVDGEGRRELKQVCSEVVRWHL